MNLQIIKSIDGSSEYVLLPIPVYKALKNEINREMKKSHHDDNDYDLFDPSDYLDNPIALARIKAGITQQGLAKRMKVSQAYISKAEGQAKPSPKLLLKVQAAIEEIKAKRR